MIEIRELYKKFKLSSGVCIDSRKLEEKCIFFCLKGDNFDGHTFAADSLIKGASFVVVDNVEYYDASNPCYILVENTLTTLQRLANYHRDQFRIPVIAITGSNGKTTTKELLYAALSTKFKTHATKGNFNNHIGLPLTLLDMPEDTDIAIIEMGASAQGEINFLCNIAQPNYGIITNIGKAHLEGFGSLEGIKRGKGELYKYIRNHDGKLFVNTDLDYLVEMSYGMNIVTYGSDEAFKTYGKIINHHPYISILYNNEHIINTQLVGNYNFYNILVAISVARYFNIESNYITKSIEEYTPTINRSQSMEYAGAKIILDAYNANPSSMLAAINSFEEKPKERSLVLLGDMLELGKDSKSEHQKIIDRFIASDIDQAVFVGQHFYNVGKDQDDKRMKVFISLDDAKQWFESNNWSGWDILIKGSRSLNMEAILT